MRHGAPWYKRFPSDFLGGVQGMTDRQHAVYSVILDLIYQYGGECRNDPKHISGFFSNMGAAAARNAIDELLAMGKIQLTNSGNLTQKRAENEVKTQEKRRKNAADFGRLGAEKRWHDSENNDLPEATPKNKKMQDTDTDTDTDKKEPSVPKKGMRIPDDFEPDLEWAMREGMTLSEAKTEAANFRDFWSAKTGKDATKLDWPATWRTWVRNGLKRKRGPPGGKSAFQEHQDRATATLERALKRGNGHDERFDFDDGQPAFDLAPGDFRTVRKAGSGQ